VLGICRLCNQKRELQDSHVLPHFIYKWLKETSATGFLRFGREPNRRVQDGYKMQWLCLDCEQRLNVWETQFATRLFHPLNDGATKILYGEWLLKFSVSVSWRTLLLMKDNEWLSNFTEPQRNAANEALQTWAKFLLTKTSHPGRFEQHLLVLGAIEQSSIGNLPANINRYILRTIDIDVVRNDSTAFILSKLGKIIILGFIDVAYPKQWIGTKVHVHKGTVLGADYTVPKQFGDYLIAEARRFAAIHANISKTQRARMDEAMWNSLGRLAKSGSMEAMRHDVRLAGRKAFEIHRPKDHKE
jgi:hypothetical protein